MKQQFAFDFNGICSAQPAPSVSNLKLGKPFSQYPLVCLEADNRCDWTCSVLYPFDSETSALLLDGSSR